MHQKRNALASWGPSWSRHEPETRRYAASGVSKLRKLAGQLGRYAAPQWLNIRRWLDANPHDELAGDMRAELTAVPVRHARYRREYLGWGVFALMGR